MRRTGRDIGGRLSMLLISRSVTPKISFKTQECIYVCVRIYMLVKVLACHVLQRQMHEQEQHKREQQHTHSTMQQETQSLDRGVTKPSAQHQRHMQPPSNTNTNTNKDSIFGPQSMAKAAAGGGLLLGGDAGGGGGARGNNGSIYNKLERERERERERGGYSEEAALVLRSNQGGGAHEQRGGINFFGPPALQPHPPPGPKKKNREAGGVERREADGAERLDADRQAVQRDLIHPCMSVYPDRDLIQP
jgi:hypothetical protein